MFPQNQNKLWNSRDEQSNPKSESDKVWDIGCWTLLSLEVRIFKQNRIQFRKRRIYATSWALVYHDKDDVWVQIYYRKLLTAPLLIHSLFELDFMALWSPSPLPNHSTRNLLFNLEQFGITTHHYCASYDCNLQFKYTSFSQELAEEQPFWISQLTAMLWCSSSASLLYSACVYH